MALAKAKYPIGVREFVRQKFKCSACKDTGFVDSKKKPGYVTRCECKLKRDFARRLESSGLPLEFLDHEPKFDDWVGGVKEAKRQVFSWVEQWSRDNYEGRDNLLIMGVAGSGKTFLAQIAIFHLMKKIKMKCGILPSRDLVGRCRKAIEDGDGWHKPIEEFKHYAFLAIDEIHHVYGSETDTRWVSELVWGRYNWRKPTIFVTERTEEELSRDLSQSFFRRLFDDSVVVKLPKKFPRYLIQQKKEERQIAANEQGGDR